MDTYFYVVDYYKYNFQISTEDFIEVLLLSFLLKETVLLDVLCISNYLEIKAKEIAQSVTMHYASLGTQAPAL